MFDRVKLIYDNNKLKDENKLLCKTNQDLNKKLQRNKFNRQETINFVNNTTQELLNLQDINSLGIEEDEKNKHRNIIINKLIENCLDKINELSNTDQSLR